MPAAPLTGALPDLGPGRHLRALTLRESELASQRRQHRAGEGGTNAALVAGTALLGPVGTDAGTAPAAGAAGRRRRRGPRSSATTCGSRSSSPGRSSWCGPGLAERAPLRVLADATTVALAGTNLRLDTGGSSVAATVVGTLARFPTVPGPFLVLDAQALSDALDDIEPGTGPPRELWIADADAGLPAALAQPPYDRLAVTLQAAACRTGWPPTRSPRARSWLLARGRGRWPCSSAPLALVLLVVGARRDDAGELLAWRPTASRRGTLRRVLFLRAAFVAVPARHRRRRSPACCSPGRRPRLVAVSATGATPRAAADACRSVPAWTSGRRSAACSSLALLVAAGDRGRARCGRRWPARPQEELR